MATYPVSERLRNSWWISAAANRLAYNRVDAEGIALLIVTELDKPDGDRERPAAVDGDLTGQAGCGGDVLGAAAASLRAPISTRSPFDCTSARALRSFGVQSCCPNIHLGWIGKSFGVKKIEFALVFPMVCGRIRMRNSGLAERKKGATQVASPLKFNQ